MQQELYQHMKGVTVSDAMKIAVILWRYFDAMKIAVYFARERT